MQCPYTSNNTYQHSKKQKQETYRFKKMKFTEIRSRITKKPKHRLCSQHRTKNAPKTYRNPIKRTIRYYFKDQKKQCPFKKSMPMVPITLHTLLLRVCKVIGKGYFTFRHIVGARSPRPIGVFKKKSMLL